MVGLLLLLALSLLLVSVGAELLVRGAVGLARRLRISPFFVGLTIVGFGTSTPELFTSLVAARRGADDLAVGNAVGSNVFNIALILGVTALLVPIPVRFAALRSQLVWALAAALVPFAALAADGRLTAGLGAGFLLALALYVGLGYRAGRREAQQEAGTVEGALGIDRGGWAASPAVDGIVVACGLGLLIGGSSVLVDSATGLARAFGISELVIGLTIVAGGTSAPELFTSLVAALRRQSDLSIGNILGSNVFNSFGILGLASLLSPQSVNPQILRLDAPLLAGLSLALVPILRSGSRIARGEGALLLAVYAVYVWALFAWAPSAFGG